MAWTDPTGWNSSNGVPRFEFKSEVGTVGVGMNVPSDFVGWLEDNGLSVWLKGSKVTFTKSPGASAFNVLAWFAIVQFTQFNEILEYKIGASWEESQPWCEFRLTQDA